MRGLIVLGLIAGLLLSTTAIGAGGVIHGGPADPPGAALTLPAGVELSDAELDQVRGELLPIWVGFAVSLAARAVVRAVYSALQSGSVGAQVGAAAEITRQALEGRRPDAIAVMCAAAGGAVTGVWAAGRSTAVPAVAGAIAGTVAAHACRP